LDADPVATDISERGKRPGAALADPAPGGVVGRRDARCGHRVVAEPP